MNQPQEEEIIPATQVQEEEEESTNSRQISQSSPKKLFIQLVRAIMNAVTTIFGIGVGVGMVLGDAFKENRHGLQENNESQASREDRNRFHQRGVGSGSRSEEARSISQSQRRSMLPPQ
ncbi:predicted protein [Chaetoceros tenuissimus]|uniref:Uncharacterized protein n=1 Tax=Chaetoceros tenuissimus TaxID=426638 RepID=A0AAD3D7G0_9STRA|nr:predicted protein [Chaetoceros tenuissimus]